VYRDSASSDPTAVVQFNLEGKPLSRTLLVVCVIATEVERVIDALVSRSFSRRDYLKSLDP